MTSSNGNIFRVTGLCAGNSPATGEFLAQRPVMQSFDVFFYLRLNKQPWGWWFETPLWSLWRHRNDTNTFRTMGPLWGEPHICERNPPTGVWFSHKGTVIRGSGVSLWLGRIICWTNSRISGDLSRYSLNVMSLWCRDDESCRHNDDECVLFYFSINCTFPDEKIYRGLFKWW